MVTIAKVLNFVLKPFSKTFFPFIFLGIALTFLWGVSIGTAGVLIGFGGGPQSLFTLWLVVYLGGYPIMMGAVAKLISLVNKNFRDTFYSLMLGGIGFVLFWVIFIS